MSSESINPRRSASQLRWPVWLVLLVAALSLSGCGGGGGASVTGNPPGNGGISTAVDGLVRESTRHGVIGAIGGVIGHALSAVYCYKLSIDPDCCTVDSGSRQQQTEYAR